LPGAAAAVREARQQLRQERVKRADGPPCSDLRCGAGWRAVSVTERRSSRVPGALGRSRSIVTANMHNWVSAGTVIARAGAGPLSSRARCCGARTNVATRAAWCLCPRPRTLRRDACVHVCRRVYCSCRGYLGRRLSRRALRAQGPSSP
jgi:hypothetical protein